MSGGQDSNELSIVTIDHVPTFLGAIVVALFKLLATLLQVNKVRVVGAPVVLSILNDKFIEEPLSAPKSDISNLIFNCPV